MDDRTHIDEAAHWFLRLQDTSAHAETFLEWQRWLNAAPEHRRAFDEIEETMLRMRRVPAPPPLPTAKEMVEDPYDGSFPIRELRKKPGCPVSRSPSVGKRLYLGLAAGLAAVSVLCGWIWLEAARESRYGVFTYVTAPGERQVLELPDGSSITMDADSALRAELRSKERVLRLERGESYFQVAKDPARPFVVHAGGARVRAVGTAFNVRMSANRTVVAVVEGKVEVSSETPALSERAAVSSGSLSPGSTGKSDSNGRAEAAPEIAAHGKPDDTPVQLFAQLGAGAAVVAYANDGQLDVLSSEAASIATSWLEGRRQYRNEPLRYVLADVDRYTEQRIEIADARTGDLEFTGTLNLENSEAWLRGLSVALPVTMAERENGSILVRMHKGQ